MATVYLAVARAGVKNVRKLVVLKLLNENLTANDDAIAMFLREARLAAELSHPNVVSTYTVGQEEGRYYILMEYLEGVSLRRLMRHADEWSLSDRFPLLGALCLALSGLKYVHDFHDYQGNNLNLVHRDVKPDNIFLTTAGQVKLLDFGVAKIRSADYDGTLGGEVIKGTVQYLAPEAVRAAGDVDQRSDIFSAGVVLTELSTGARFWGDETYPAILTRLSRDELPPVRSADGEELPPALRRICESALQPDREKRIQTAFELRKSIQGFLVKQGYVLDTSDLAALVQEVYAPIQVERADAIREEIGRAHV
jgi:eukaryotic-like serine/threonine-protein kinase